VSLPPLGEEAEGERLQKVLSRAGFGSRRVCEDLIAEGRVTVNGSVAALGRRVRVEVDQVEVDGARVAVQEGLVHYLLNKPRGVVSTASDPEGRRTVVDLVPQEPRVYPVGRLDADTEGLLLLTNDGDLTHRLTTRASAWRRSTWPRWRGCRAGRRCACSVRASSSTTG
jgi:23S rRNA pseudouridine2605 synthase